MKYYCDRCKKPTKITDATIVTVKRFSITHIILCEKCANELDRFLNNKEIDKNE